MINFKQRELSQMLFDKMKKAWLKPDSYRETNHRLSEIIPS